MSSCQSIIHLLTFWAKYSRLSKWGHNFLDYNLLLMICKLGQIFQLFPTSWLPRTFGNFDQTNSHFSKNSMRAKAFQGSDSLVILDLLHLYIRVPVLGLLSGDGRVSRVSPGSWLARSLVAGVVTARPHPRPLRPLYHHHRQYLYHWSPILSPDLSSLRTPLQLLLASLLPAQGHWYPSHIVIVLNCLDLIIVLAAECKCKLSIFV